MLKLNESWSACKCLSSSARIMRMMKRAAGRYKALHGCLAALSGEHVLLRDFTLVCSFEDALQTDISIRGIYVRLQSV